MAAAGNPRIGGSNRTPHPARTGHLKRSPFPMRSSSSGAASRCAARSGCGRAEPEKLRRVPPAGAARLICGMESRTVSRRVGRLHLTAATLVAAVLSAACSPASNPRDAPAEVAGRTLPPGSSVAVITGATVVAFWLKGADTIPAATRRQVQNEFRRSNLALAQYLSDTDVGVVATVNDTVQVRLASGALRLVMLSGLD